MTEPDSQRALDAHAGERWWDTARKLFGRLAPWLGVVFFCIALWALYDALQHYRYVEIVHALERMSISRILWALSLTAIGYVVLTGYDALGFRSIHRPFPYRNIALASFIGYAFGNNVGNTLIGGAAVRYWIYSSFGVSPAEVTRIVVFCSVTFWVALAALGGLVLSLLVPGVAPSPYLHFISTRALGVSLLVALAAYLVALTALRCSTRVHPPIEPPSVTMTCAQIGIGTTDLLLMGSVLYVLLPAASAPSYPEFLAVFLLALILGIVSQVPGGLGVFEGSLLAMLGARIPPPELAAALLMFRAIYYLLPLIAAIVLIAVREGVHGLDRAPLLRSRLGAWVRELVPQALAITTLVGGAVLLFSGATPSTRGRLSWLHHVLPLPVIETSHFLGSLVGAALLVLARGLQRRLDAAYGLSLALLLAGALLSIAKGFDYEEAILLALMAAALAPCRRYFYREASLLGDRFTVEWIATILVVMIGSAWLATFAFKHVEYSHELWWAFALRAEAPRSMRAIVGAIALLVIVAIARLLRPAVRRAPRPLPADIERARPIVERSPNTHAYLALRGDKSLLFSERGNAFLMYGRAAQSWIALGDPVGPPDEARELAWQFRDLCDRHGARAVFFEVGLAYLDVYLDLNLQLHKLGEEARVDLRTFDIHGARHRDLRQASSRLARKGYRFELVSNENTAGLVPALAEISEAWLTQKATREKGFSNASFEPRYLSQFPIALVRDNTKVIAFANVLRGAAHTELSVDLMRHRPDAPNGTMDFLFTELLMWGKAQGYSWFNFGMAPLSGLAERGGAPLWHRAGALIYQHGEHFYNFQGLRRFKGKFDPQWSPRYLACAGGIALPYVLLDVASLIAGGVKGIVAK